MAVKIIHTADNHLDPKLGFLGAKSEERRRDFYLAFKRLVDFALEVKPHILLVSGDLFDSVNPRNPARTRVMEAFKRLSSEGVRIFAIGGNHDMPRSREEGMSPLQEIEAAGHARFFGAVDEFEVEHLSVEGYDVVIAGVSYDHTLSVEDNPLRSHNIRIPVEGDLNIAMLHYNFSGFRVPKSWAAPTITAEDVPKGLHYLALGHLHAHSYMRVGSALAVYPGSTERRSFNEEGDEKKGFVYAELDGREVKLQFVETPARRMKTFVVQLDENVEDPVSHVLSSLRQRDPELLARLVLRGSLPLAKIAKYSRAELLKRLENSFFHVVIDDSELKCYLKEVDVAVEAKSPIESFREYLLSAIEKAESGEAQVLRRALDIGLKVLQEVGAW